MSYCFNPYCPQPQNSIENNICFNCQSPLLLQNRYRGLKIIGQGGMGRTFLVEDEKDQITQSYYVVKQFFPQSQNISDHKKVRELFAAEAIRLEQLGQHPQIPRLYKYFTENEYQYLVQEWIQGDNLIKFVKNKSIVQEQDIIRILKNLLPVLEFVHNNHIIHRDIKPENIIFCPDRTLVLVDFGAAKLFKDRLLQQTGTIIGSPEYIAPEQLRGKAVFSSDIYSLGITCLYLLTGVSPFDLYSDSEDNWVWRDYLCSNTISLELGQIIDRMIVRATARRYISAKQALQDLNTKILCISQSATPTPNKINKIASTHSKELVLTSESGVVYTKLRDYLRDKKWQQANQITEQLLLQASQQYKKNWLERDDLKNLTCEDLSIIDRLWNSYSQENFGFSIQYDIWQKLDHQNYQKFGKKVGWYVEKRWLLKKNINFSLSAPKGHLPVISWWFGHAIWGLRGLFSKMDTCFSQEKSLN